MKNLTIPDDVFESNKRAERAYLENKKNKKKEDGENRNSAIEKIKAEILERLSPEELDQRKVALLKTIDQISAKEILQVLLEKKECPLITSPGWTKCVGYKQGEETWCRNIGFINCSVFNKYVAYQLIDRIKKQKEIKGKNQTKIKEKGAKRKT